MTNECIFPFIRRLTPSVVVSPLRDLPILAGRYVLSELLGFGGFASVWEVHDVLNDQIIAIKFGKEKYLSREYATQSKLKHPNVVECADQVAHQDVEGNKFFGLVMEKMDSDLSVTLVSRGYMTACIPFIYLQS